jgi:inositol phosphorylceramide mannosyltransferase catalytic subunit
MTIPRILHHIWLGRDPLPEEHKPWIESWKRHHPNWEHRLWTEDNLPLNPLRPEVLDRLRAPVERADILRLEILYTHGGVYLDTDLECLRPLDDILEDHTFVGVCHKQGRITNTAIAAIPAHPLLDRAMHEIKPLDFYWTGNSDTLKDVAGPRLLQRLLSEFPDVMLLDPPLFFPSNAEERQYAIAVHHMARVWHNTTTLRAAMLRAERRLERVREQLELERRAHGATKKRLARLESRGEEQPADNGLPSDNGETPAPAKRRRKKTPWLRSR